MRQRRMKRGAIQNSVLRDASFQRAKPSPLISKARNYVKNWEQVRENNVGLVLMGEVGIGKSYAAACICNALLEQGVWCYMTSLVHVLNMSWEDRAMFLSNVPRYELLVLDDLGAEANTGYRDETVFSVVDARYRAKKPMIVTTNLGLENLKNPPNIEKARVYDRILGVCGPVRCKGDNLRKAKGEESRQTLAESFGRGKKQEKNITMPLGGNFERS